MRNSQQTMANEDLQEPFTTANEVAYFFRVNIFHIYRLALANRIPSYKIGKLRRFKMSEIKAWCEDKKAATQGEGTKGDCR